MYGSFSRSDEPQYVEYGERQKRHGNLLQFCVRTIKLVQDPSSVRHERSGVISSHRVISSVRELEEAEAMTKGIAQHRQSAPGECPRLLLEPRSRRHGTLDGCANIVDFKIEMHRRPMSMIVSDRSRLRRRLASARFFQEIDRRGTTEHLGDRTAEKAPAEMKTECSPIEFDAAFDVVDIHVD